MSFMNILAWYSIIEIQMASQKSINILASYLHYQINYFSDYFPSLLRDFTKFYETPWSVHLGLNKREIGFEPKLKVSPANFKDYLLFAFKILVSGSVH